MANIDDPYPIHPSRWKPGQSGNPKGRPKKRLITDILRELGEETIELDGGMGEKERMYYVAEQAWQLAMKGKTTLIGNKIIELQSKEWADFIEWLFNRIDGPPVQIRTTDGRQVGGVVFVIPHNDRDELPDDIHIAPEWPANEVPNDES